MNPVPVQKGVEIISGLQTSQSTIDAALSFVQKMGKTPSQSADSPGFLANRILMPYINEAIICLETGVGKKEDIDGIMKNGTNVPMGPLQLADFVGLDTCLAIMEVLHREMGDGKYRPAVLLRKMVDAGWLGKKSGKGKPPLTLQARTPSTSHPYLSCWPSFAIRSCSYLPTSVDKEAWSILWKEKRETGMREGWGKRVVVLLAVDEMGGILRV
ncbi:MAG: hypothetical protein Q9228_003985 [Teloschistes exilis]